MSTATHNAEALAQKLADSGLRSTPQREVVYDVLLRKRDHPTADEVFARVKSGLPSISLATVYNCLETLVQCDLVRAVNFALVAHPNVVLTLNAPVRWRGRDVTTLAHRFDDAPAFLRALAAIRGTA